MRAGPTELDDSLNRCCQRPLWQSIDRLPCSREVHLTSQPWHAFNQMVGWCSRCEAQTHYVQCCVPQHLT